MKHWITPDWPVLDNVHAATTLRTGGLSQSTYHSFNLAQHVGDDADRVADNRGIIAEMLQLPAEPFWLTQVHGNKVIRAERNPAQEEADASFTDHAGVVCSILTADCLPILLCNKQGTRIAAAHAGWRGLLAGIIDRTVDKFQGQEILVWLGPAIGPKSFAVGADVYDSFANKSVKYRAAFSQCKKAKWLADIYHLAEINLLELGVREIYGGQYCTYSDAERFYSYRRDGETGRMATLIWRD